MRKTGEVEEGLKFAKNVRIAPNDIITVWSSDENKKNEPPHTIVMKKQRWPVADVMETILRNKEEQVRFLNFGKFPSDTVDRCLKEKRIS